MSLKQQFDEQVRELLNGNNETLKKLNLMSTNAYNYCLNVVKSARALQSEKRALTTEQYKLLKRYHIISVENKLTLIDRRCALSGLLKIYVTSDDLFNIIDSVHSAIGHNQLKGMFEELNKKYANITTEVIELYLNLCKGCRHIKKQSMGQLVIEPINTNYKNTRCLVNLVDMETEHDEEFNFILNYQDYLTKYCILRPLKTNAPEEIADKLIDIFCLFGAKYLMMSENGPYFLNSVYKSLKTKWPELMIVHDTEDFVGTSNQEVKEVLASWMMKENTNKWADGLRFIQLEINQCYHHGIQKSPFEAVFGQYAFRERKIPQDDEMRDADNTSDEESDSIENQESAGKKVCIICDDQVVVPLIYTHFNGHWHGICPNKRKVDDAKEEKVCLFCQKTVNDDEELIDLTKSPQSSEERATEYCLSEETSQQLQAIKNMYDRPQKSSFCGCKTFCRPKTCLCIKNNTLCNATCHNYRSCSN